MNRAQRRLHAGLWPVLALLLVAVIAAALVARGRVAEAQAHAITKTRP